MKILLVLVLLLPFASIAQVTSLESIMVIMVASEEVRIYQTADTNSKVIAKVSKGDYISSFTLVNDSTLPMWHTYYKGKVGYVLDDREKLTYTDVGSSRVDLQACKLEYSIVSPK